MDLGNINLNLATLLYQQSILFMHQLEKHTRQVQEVILSNLLPLGSNIEQSQSQEQSNEDVQEQVKVEAQEYHLEQRQKQMKYQLSNLKKARQEEGIYVGVPDLIDGIYLLKDKIRTPVYIKRDVQKNYIEKLGQKSKQNNKGSKKKQVKCASKLEKSENNTEINAQFEDKHSPIEKKTQQNVQEKILFVDSEDKIQIQQTSRQERKQKTEQKGMNKTKKSNGIKPQRKAKNQQQCQNCSKKFNQLLTLQEHEACDHGIVRQKQLLSDELQEKINEKTEIGQQEQQYQGEIDQIQKN